MMFAKDDLIAALRLRYDYYSAQGAFDRARERAGIPEKTELDAKEVRALRAALAAGGDRVEGVLARIDLMLEASPVKSDDAKPAKEAKKADKPEPEKAEPPKAEPPKAEPPKAEAAEAPKP